MTGLYWVIFMAEVGVWVRADGPEEAEERAEKSAIDSAKVLDIHYAMSVELFSEGDSENLYLRGADVELIDTLSEGNDDKDKEN